MPSNTERRQFLARILKAAAMGTVLTRRSLFGLSAAASALGTSDYKAIIQVTLFGGCDMGNVRVPTDTRGYANYASLRGGLALPQASLIPLTSTNFGLHPSMPNLAALFNAGNAAVLANTGPLIQPVTAAEARAGLLLPSNLMSHPDQQNLVQTLGTSTSQPDGPGGHIADQMSYLGPGGLPMATSVTGTSLPFLEGRIVSSFIAPISSLGAGCAQDRNCQSAQTILNLPSPLLLVQREQLLQQQMYKYKQVYADAIQGAQAFQTPMPANNGLAAQFEEIVNMLSVRNALGGSRMIFGAGLGGFDTHTNQLPIQAQLLSTLDGALGFLWGALRELGLTNDVVILIYSEFGRQWSPGATSGSSHGFGNDAIVMGGPVLGGQIYGKIPVMEIGGPDDFTGDGRLLPSTSTSSVLAEIALWFGASQAQLAAIVPEYANFPNSLLGFLGQINSGSALRNRVPR